MKKIYLLFILLFAFVQVGFGQSLPDNWTGDSGIDTYQETTTVHGGSSSCKVSVNTGSQASTDMRNAEVAVSEGNTYTYSFWGYTSTHVKIRAVLEWNGASITYGSYISANSGAWAQLTITGTVPSGATGVKVGVRFYDVSGFTASEIQYIDDFSFESPTGNSLSLSNGDMENWPMGVIDNPTAFSASAGSTANDIDLSWTQNGSSDNVMVAYNTSNTFGVPTNGSAYSVGNTIAGGGEVVYNGSGESYNHSSLTANTTYYYKAWSVDGSTDYSSGVETNATTSKAEPTDHFNTFTAVANATTIDLTWMDAAGGTEPDGYLIRANKTGTFTAPVDGTDEADATDANGGTVKVSQGTETYSWGGLDASTQYYFKAWAYTNSGSHINYKTDGTVPTANATTGAAIVLPNAWINEIHYDDAGGDADEFVEVIIETPDSYALSDFQIDLYNGNGGAAYKTVTLDNYTIGTTYNEGGSTFTLYYYDYTADGGIQNGAPDGVALSYQSNLIQFLSYEGSFAATDGVANGVTSTDIGVSESSVAEGSSLGLTGAGTKYSDFTWATFDASATPGTKNGSQNLPVELTSFTATNVDGGVMLNWTTATEVNNYGFEVEASTSLAIEWETVGFVNGHGNSNSPKEYSYFVNSGATSFRLKQIDNDGKFEYSDVVTVSVTLAKTELLQNHPNPFNPSTQINFVLANAGLVNISVYNALGQKVAELVNSDMNAGTHNVEFNANNFASGLYFYRLETSSFSQTMKMLLLK